MLLTMHTLDDGRGSYFYTSMNETSFWLLSNRCCTFDLYEKIVQGAQISEFGFHVHICYSEAEPSNPVVLCIVETCFHDGADVTL